MNWLKRRVEAWVEQKEALLRAQYEPKLAGLENSLKESLQGVSALLDKANSKKELVEQDLQYLEERLTDRRIELLKAEDDLKEQIKLLEAKAKPDSVWVTAYTAGFNRAMDMLPEFSAIVRGKIESQAIDAKKSRRFI